MRTRTAALLVAALATCAAVPRAHADAAHAWAAAKANLPGESNVVVGLNISTIRKSLLFAQLYPLLIAQKPEVQAGLDLAKSTCNIDPLDAIDGAVVGTDAEQKTGAVYIALHNLDQTKLISCFEAIAKTKSKDAKVTVKKDGNISELTSTDSPDKIYVGWVGSDVIVIGFDAKDKAALAKWMNGKGGLAKAAIGKSLGKINTTAAGWASVVKETDLDGSVKMKAGYGSVDLTGGNIAADVRIQLGSPADATKESGVANKQLNDLLASGSIPPAIVTLAKSLKIGTNGDELTVKASAAEKDVLSLVTMYLSMMGAGGAAHQ